MTTFLITVTAFDNRSVVAWSTVVGGEVSPIQHIGRASGKSWADVIGSILETDSVRVCVTDRRSAAVR